jgi:glycosyltransferase involved in cell wall biosynthesis
MAPLTACTIVSKNYIAFARVVARSFLAAEPEGRFFVLLVDRNDGHIDPEAEPFTLVEVEELQNIRNLPTFLFKYTLLECNTAVKPFFLEYLFERYGLENLVYFDPDILITGSLDELRQEVDDHSIVLTPHLTHPIGDDAHPGELAILQAGAYNLGFIGLGSGEMAQALLRWWQDRLYDQCVVRIDQALFVDQKWIDLVPGLFPDVSVITKPGYNVAYWNLHRRTVTCVEGSWRSNGEELVFFHFSGIQPESLEQVSKHQNRFQLADLGAAADLYRLYRDQVVEAGYFEALPWPYAFGHFEDGTAIPNLGRALYHQLPEEERRRFGNPFSTAGDTSFLHWLNGPAPGASRHPPHPTRLLSHLHASRADLVANFPKVPGADFPAYSSWLRDYGRHELKLGEAFLGTLHRESRGTLFTVDGLKRRLKNRLKRFYHSATGQATRRIVRDVLGRERSQSIRQRLRPVSPTPPPAVPAARRLPMPTMIERPGINLVGYLQAETGMGEAARSLALALEQAGIPVSRHSLDLGVVARNQDPTFVPQTSEFPYDINLIVVNADQVQAVREHLGPEVFVGRYNIGFWLWELARFPISYQSAFDPFHEIWTPSTFCVDAISTISPVPVRRLPLPVEPLDIPPFGRSHFNLPEKTFVVLFMFNFLSYMERKNPLAAIRAFRQAFAAEDDALLLLKTSQSDFAPEARREIEEAIGDAKIRLLDAYLDRDEILSLTACADAYLSLHRAEGFGLTLAEAMYYAKPVISTPYSGTADFVDLNNSLPVRYHLVELAEDAGPYPAGAVWAEPSAKHAAEHLRTLYADRQLGVSLGKKAREDVRNNLSHHAVGRILKERFAEVLRQVRERQPLLPRPT